MKRTSDLNIAGAAPLISPISLKSRYPMTQESNRTVVESREIVRRIIAGRDRRLLAIVGPCSIHDPPAALDYARHLHKLKQDIEQNLSDILRFKAEMKLVPEGTLERTSHKTKLIEKRFEQE